MKHLMMLVMAVALFAVPLTGSAKRVRTVAPEAPVAAAVCPAPCPAPVCPAPCPAPCSPCMVNPLCVVGGVVGGVVSGVGCVISGIGNAVGGLFCGSPCCP